MKCDKLSSAFSCVLLLLLGMALLSFPFGIRGFIVMSGSMEPELEVGSLCFVNTKIPYSELKEKDVITYSVLEQKITHRIVNVSDKGLVTKGDSNSTEDIGIVTEENYYGKLIGNIPKVGYFLFYLRKNGILLCGFFSICLLLQYLKRDKINEEKSLSIPISKMKEHRKGGDTE